MPKKTIKKNETKDFSITLTMGSDVYQGSGVTALEALTSMPKPVKIMSKGILRIEGNGKKKEIFMYPVRLRRLFYNKLFQQIQLKSLLMFMK